VPSVTAYDCRRDCFDGYLYVQNNLNDELAKAGEDIKIDATRCIASGGSAGGTLVVNLVRSPSLISLRMHC
jgi:acetyl esterase/lipase